MLRRILTRLLPKPVRSRGSGTFSTVWFFFCASLNEEILSGSDKRDHTAAATVYKFEIASLFLSHLLSL